MDDLLTLSPGSGISYYLVLIVIGAVNIIRWLLYKSNKPWTNKIQGKRAWVPIAAVISIALCVVFEINVIKDIINVESIGSIKLTGYTGYVISGIALSLSSNLGAYITTIPSKAYIKDLKEDCSPTPGLPENTNSKPPIEEPLKTIEPVEETPEKTHSYMTKFLDLWESDSRPAFILVERDDGKKAMIKVSEDKYEEQLKEAWSKISNLEI